MTTSEANENESTLALLLQTKASSRILFDQVCKQRNLLEVDYFGLEYLDDHNVTVRKNDAWFLTRGSP